MNLRGHKPEQIEPQLHISDDLCSVDPWWWAYTNRIKLQGGYFSEVGRDYQIGLMQSKARVKVWMKATQLGMTEAAVLETIHGLIYRRYPKGTLYLFPTGDDVSAFSKTRFSPLIKGNPYLIGRFVTDNNSTELKQFAEAVLYLRGARTTQKVEGEKKESSKLRSIPVDKVVFDEVDLMDPDMIFLALQRMGDSKIKEELYLSTPTIPDFGIDKLYSESDQHIWIIKCPQCGRDCCLELDFPECVQFKNEGAYRACKRCGHELSPVDGQWVAQFPGRETEGRWISQLNSLSQDPGEILRLFENPPNGNMAEVYNSKLGQAYIAAENRLNLNDVYNCCGTHILSSKDIGPSGMGVDVGKTLHVVIGKKIQDKVQKKIIWMGEVKEFADLKELATRYGVRIAAIDYEPETRQARDFQKNAAFSVYLCDEMDKVRQGDKTNEMYGVTKVARTEICDDVLYKVRTGKYLFPRRSPQIEAYAKQMVNIAKVYDEDKRTGGKVGRFRKLADKCGDHFFHATAFFEIATKTLETSTDDPYRDMLSHIVGQKEQYHPLFYAMGGNDGIFIQ